MRTRRPTLWPQSATHRWLLAGAVLIPLLVLMIVAAQSWRTTFRAHENSAALSVDILHEHAAKLFETQQLVIWQVDALIAGMSWEEIETSRDLHDSLRRTADLLPQVRNIWLIDSQGRARASTHSFPVSDVNLADRDYFQAVRGGAKGPYVSRGYAGRATGQYQFNVASARTTAPGNGFDGVIAVSAFPNYLEEFYARASTVPGYVIGLLREDGHMLARHPSLQGTPVQLSPDNHMLLAIREGAERGLHWAESEVQGSMRLYAWRRVGQLPVHVIFAVPRATIIADWFADFMVDAILALAAIAALVALVVGAGKRRRLEMELLENRFETVQQLSPHGVLLLTSRRTAEKGIADFDITYANPAAQRLFGLAEGHTGRSLCDRLPHSCNEGGLLRRLRRAVEQGEGQDLDLSFEKDGVPGWFRVSAIKLDDGVAMQVSDVTERRAVQEGLRSALAERDRLLEQKELLIKEVNHRVKNSLQLVSGMLSLEALSVGDLTVRRWMEEAMGRVRAIAAVHERLYRTDDVERIEVGALLTELCGHLAQQLGLPPDHLQVAADGTCVLTDRAIPLALLTNELVTNALKHGTAPSAPVRVEIGFHESEGRFRLEVRDHGPGLPPGFDPSRSPGLGMRIAQGLAAQLGGRVSFESAQPGTRAVLIGAIDGLTSRAA